MHDLADELYDPAKVEQDRWIGDRFVAALGEAGLLGLYVPEQYGGRGLSQSGYCRVSEEFGRIDATLATVMGVHQSIGVKGIHLFGTDEQKERFLPDLAAGRKLAGFALTEPTTGSDAYDLQTRAELESDGSWRLNGEKRWIGNGNRDVVVCFARSEEHGHVALILTPDMEGFESPFRYDTMGLRGNDLRHLTFTDVRVPPENLLDLLSPVRSGGLILDHVISRVRRRVVPPRTTHVHPELRPLAAPLSDQVAQLRSVSERLLRQHGTAVKTQQHQHKRLAHAAMDITAQVATLSRATALMNDEGVDGTATERFIAETYCTRAARRVGQQFDLIESNDDDPMNQIAQVAYRRGGSGFELYGGR